jgi:hypothetical protein
MSMFRKVALTFAAALALTPAVPAAAQQSVDLVARVPFEFTVGGTSLPRDTYQLSRLNGHAEMLLVRSERKGVFVRTGQVRLPRRAAAASLVFHRYGDQYFLREVNLEGSTRLEVPETGAEREAADRRADRTDATMETIVVPASRQ